MEIIAIATLVTLLFWGMIRNLRVAGEIATLGTVASATKFTATTAKTCTPEDLKIIEELRKL